MNQSFCIPRNYLYLAQSARKITHRTSDWFWFCFSLVERLNPINRRSNRSRVITFDSHLKTAVMAENLASNKVEVSFMH